MLFPGERPDMSEETARLGRAIKWDPQAEKMLGDDQAAGRLKRAAAGRTLEEHKDDKNDQKGKSLGNSHSVAVGLMPCTFVCNRSSGAQVSLRQSRCFLNFDLRLPPPYFIVTRT